VINIVIADHQAIFRAGVAKILAVEDDLRIVGQPNLLEQLLVCLDKLRTKVLLLSSGFTADLSRVVFAAQRSGAAVIVLAEGNESATQFTNLGASGVVYRSVPGDCMVEAVRRASRGESYIQVQGATSSESSPDIVGMRVRDRLSDKEVRIMAAVVRGFKNRDIAMQLYTSEQVVKNALRNIFDKTGVSDRLELALFVLHHKVLAQATSGVQIEPQQRKVKRAALPTVGPKLLPKVPPFSVQ
jgi:DNA-binding NarL/FixJ family response regulator